MSLFPAFDADDAPPPQAARLAPKLRALAGRGIYFGTSSWKYEGWLGSIYSEGRYKTRGKHSKKKFEETCLAEYAETFPAVCGDFAFYQFPSERVLGPAVRRDARRLPLRLQGARGHHRRHLADSRQVRAAGRGDERAFPGRRGCSSGPSPAASTPTGPAWRP